MLLFVLSTEAAAQSVFLVRHAERADTADGAPATMAADPDLSPAGRARAESLARMLKYKRTRQTAAPLAKLLRIEPTVVASKDAAGLARQVSSAAGHVLVVGHSNTLPDLIKALGVQTPVTIPDTDYDNFFIVTREGKPSLIRLHFQ
jgi:broad specificity phosphatase PhoE